MVFGRAAKKARKGAKKTVTDHSPLRWRIPHRMEAALAFGHSPLRATVKASGQEHFLLDIEHVFPACVATGHDLVEYLHELRRTPFWKSRESDLMRGLGVLLRLGYADQACDGLPIWRHSQERTILTP